MTKDKIYPQYINSQDIETFIKKNALNDTCNYLHSNWAIDKDRFQSKIYFAISLSLAIFTALFPSLIMFLILLNSLTILLIISTRKFNKQKKRFWDNRKIIKKSFSEWGLEFRD